MNLASVGGFAVAGAGASLLLSLIECVDVNIRLSPVFESLKDRLVFSTYFGVNLLVGSLIGLALGLFFFAASRVANLIQTVLWKRSPVRIIHGIAAWILVSGLAALALNQQPSIHRYVKGLLRELEKFPLLNATLLNHERSLSYLLLASGVAVCSVVWAITRNSRNLSRVARTAWLVVQGITIAAVYYVDSRVEVQLYEHSLHASMFLIEYGVGLALVSGAYLSLPGGRRLRSQPADSIDSTANRFRSVAALVAVLCVFTSVILTFWHIDKNQNVKTQIFSRTVQTRQYFRLAQWALDFDRDGYSALLGGGDADDRRADINPGRLEIADDGIDNNAIGGDLTREQLDAWKLERSSLNAIANPSPQRFNVIYIFIDALRADHLGTYGYARNISPNIDRLAERSSVFEHAYTPSPNTFEALPKFMQSSYWDGHFETWTEALTRNGYNGLLFPRRLPTQLRHIKGMRVVHEARERVLEVAIDKAIGVLEDAPSDRSFCAYLYATDPHRPYLKHGQFDFGTSLADAYDGEIAYTDQQLGKLFDWLEQTGRMKDTVIVIMADHGESLGERGIYKHSSQLYNEQARVPMIIYAPNLQPRRVSSYVSTVDLGATILNLVGIEIPKDYSGVTLLPLMRGDPSSHPAIFGEQTSEEDSPFVRRDQQLHPKSKKYMVITQDGFKLIYNRDPQTFELFDLNNDPGELRNLYDRLPQRAEALKRLLGRFIDVVLASRPFDADESQYFLPGLKDDE